MKKILMALLLIGSLSFMNRASAQRVTFYYYPDANVYYNPHTHEYAYADNDNWRYDKTLPGTYHISKKYVTVYGNSDEDEIWRDNAMHREKYKNWDKHDVKRAYKEEKKEDKKEIKREKKEEKREVKRDRK
jgi:hypothetical protein